MEESNVESLTSSCEETNSRKMEQSNIQSFIDSDGSEGSSFSGTTAFVENNVCHAHGETLVRSDSEEQELPFVTARALLAANLLRNDELLSPGFQSVAALAGWDNESLLLATQEDGACLNRSSDDNEEPCMNNVEVRSPGVVARTPQALRCDDSREIQAIRDRKREERTPKHAITPLSAGRRHRRPRSQTIHGCSPDLLPIGDLSLNQEFQKGAGFEDQEVNGGTARQHQEPSATPSVSGDTQATEENQDNPDQNRSDDRVAGCASTEGKADAEKPACLGQLRDELSCAICLDVCFEPSTTSCGHSFCRGCLQSVLQKCGPRCPKCRQQLKGDAWRSCPVNVVLWNTVQILFPTEIAARTVTSRESSEAAKKEEEQRRPPPRGNRRGESEAERLGAAGQRAWQSARARAAGLRRTRATMPAAVQERVLQQDDERLGREAIAAASRRAQEQVDAALARRLQLAELMQRSSSATNREAIPGSLTSAAANLRAVASTALRHSYRRYH